ncbi:MAG: hypothetical protein MZV65_47345 [Chromatiales bacterium]|nr:hypothetical protein [Chromatiales bacterium]
MRAPEIRLVLWCSKIWLEGLDSRFQAMANVQHHHKLPPHAQRYLVTGILTIIPILITWLVFEFVLGQLTRIGMPWARMFPALFTTNCRFCPTGCCPMVPKPAGGADHPDRPVSVGLDSDAGGRGGG